MALSVLKKRSGVRTVLALSSIRVPDLILETSNASHTVVVGESSGADTFARVQVIDEVLRAREALSGVGIPVGVGGTSKALSVLEERSGGRAVLALSGIGVPDLVLETSNTSHTIVVGEFSGADAFIRISIIDKIFMTREA